LSLFTLTPVTFAAIASAVVTAAVVALLLYAAPRVASLTRAALHRTDAAERVERIAENGAALAYWLVVLAAVLVAHRGFAGAVVPLLDGFAWAYDAAFLIASLVPLVFVVARLTVTVDPLSTLVADRVTKPESAESRGDDADGDETATTGGESDRSATEIDAADSQGHSIEERWGVDDEFGGAADDESEGTADGESDEGPTNS
jgi:hypothetical protein